MKILLLDTNLVFRSEIKSVLRKNPNVEVDFAPEHKQSHADITTWVTKNSIDVVIIDIIDYKLEVLRVLRELGVYTVVLTQREDRKALLKSIENQVRAYKLKPMNETVITDILTEIGQEMRSKQISEKIDNTINTIKPLKSKVVSKANDFFNKLKN